MRLNTLVKQRGFTLIEMAIVVAIIGLIVGGGVIAIGPITLQAKTNQTNTALDQIESALTLFAVRNNRLPCPADGSVANTSASYGIEVTQTTAIGTCELSGSSVGNSVVPWRTLGLDETYSVDGWANRISYYPANPMITGVATLVNNNTTVKNCLNRIASTSAPPQGFRDATACDVTDTTTTNSLTTGGTYGTYTVPTYPFKNYIAVYSINSGACSTELTLPNTNNTTAAAYSAAADSCTSVTAPAAVTNTNVMFDGQRAAYVLISHGPSGWYGWTRGGTQNAAPSTSFVTKRYNNGVNLAGTAGNLGFVQSQPQYTSDRSNTNYFDDIVRWRSPMFVIQQCGAGACGNP
jgi:prepilin-type N-terminal cleavage/methylation domain-containing protein